MVRQQLFLAIALISFPANVFAKAPIDPDEGRPHLSWEDAGQAIGRMAFVSGKITNVGSAGRVNFLNFSDDRNAFTGIVYENSLVNFPQPLDEMYEGKNVRIRGFVGSHRGRPEIVIAHPDQIEILEELPSTNTTTQSSPRTSKDTLTVATYNVLNLFDDEDDLYHADDSTPAKPREEMEHLAAVLRAMDADVVALQEVESRGYLERFLEVFLPDMGYEVVHFEGNDLRGIDVCLISRIPVGEVRSNRHISFPGPNGEPQRFERDALEVTLTPEGAPPFDIWVLHLKSNFEGREYAEPIRVAEARQVRKMLDEALAKDPDARILVAGDFNDTWDSETLRTIVGQGSTALWSSHQDTGTNDLITYNQEPYLTMIDFILCSPAMKKAIVPGSYQIKPGSPETSGSDHNPVLVKFKKSGMQ